MVLIQTTHKFNCNAITARPAPMGDHKMYNHKPRPKQKWKQSNWSIRLKLHERVNYKQGLDKAELVAFMR